MTANASLSQQIKVVLSTFLKREPETILPEHNLRDDLGLDSLMTFELLYDLEKTFDLEIPNEDLPGLQTIADVVKYLETRITPEDLQNVGAPSSGPKIQAANASPASSLHPASPEKSPKGGKAKKPSTGTRKAKTESTPKAKPRTSQVMKDPKRVAPAAPHQRLTPKTPNKK